MNDEPAVKRCLLEGTSAGLREVPDRYRSGRRFCSYFLSSAIYGLASSEGFRLKCSCLFLCLSEACLAWKDVFKVYARGCSSLASDQATILKTGPT